MLCSQDQASDDEHSLGEKSPSKGATAHSEQFSDGAAVFPEDSPVADSDVADWQAASQDLSRLSGDPMSVAADESPHKGTESWKSLVLHHLDNWKIFKIHRLSSWKNQASGYIEKVMVSPSALLSHAALVI